MDFSRKKCKKTQKNCIWKSVAGTSSLFDRAAKTHMRSCVLVVVLRRYHRLPRKSRKKRKKQEIIAIPQVAGTPAGTVQIRDSGSVLRHQGPDRSHKLLSSKQLWPIGSAAQPWRSGRRPSPQCPASSRYSKYGRKMLPKTDELEKSAAPADPGAMLICNSGPMISDSDA